MNPALLFGWGGVVAMFVAAVLKDEAERERWDRLSLSLLLLAIASQVGVFS